MNAWITDNIWKIIAVVSPVIVWFIKDSKLFKRNLKKQDGDIMSSNLNIYQKMLDDLDIRLEHKEEQITGLEGKLKEASDLKNALEDEIEKLKDTIKELTDKLITQDG